MRISELLDAEVVDAAGERVGKVHDVRLVQDGPYVPGFGAALRVDGLVVGSGSLAVRLGYHRHEVRGPWLLTRIFRALEQRSRFVAWERVRRTDDGAITLDCLASQLPSLLDATTP